MTATVNVARMEGRGATLFHPANMVPGMRQQAKARKARRWSKAGHQFDDLFRR